jgi:hypothetical protein
MMAVSKIKKTFVVKIRVLASEDVKTFELKIPSGASRISGIKVSVNQ